MILGQSGTALTLLPNDLTKVRVFVIVPAEAAKAAMAKGVDVMDVRFVVESADGAYYADASNTFRLPEGR